MRLTGGRQAHLLQRQLLVVAAALAGGVLAAAPTGFAIADVVWCAAFAAGLAYCGGYTQRLVMLPVVGLATAVAGSGLSLGLALAAVVCATRNSIRPGFSVRWGIASGGFLGVSLLTGSGIDDRVAAAATTAGLTLVVFIASHLEMTRRRRGWTWRVLGVAGVVVVIFGAAGGIAALLAKSSIDEGVDAFRSAEDTGVGGDLSGAVASFTKAEHAFDDAAEPLDSFGRLGRLVPGLSQQLAAASTAVEAAGDGAEAGRRAGGSLDIDDVAVSGGGVDVAAIAALESPLDQLKRSLTATVDQLSGIDRSLLVGPVSDALDDALEEAVGAARTADRLHRTVQIAPDLLGVDVPRRYLLLLTSPVEARGRLGFPSAYAVLTFDNGKLTFEAKESISDLSNLTIDQGLLDIPSRLIPYLPYKVSTHWQSTLLSPDAPSSAELIQQFARQSPVGAIDGVILADPHTMASLVGLVGPVAIPALGTELTEDTTFDFLTRDQYVAFPEDQVERKELLGVVAGLVGTKLESLSVPSLRTFTERFGPLIADGHLIIDLQPDAYPEAAALLADTDADGSFPRPEHTADDVVYLAQINNARNKIDLFLERSVDYDVQIAEDGSLSGTLEVELTNTAPASGLPDYLIGGQDDGYSRGTNQSSLFIYSPHELSELLLDGEAVLPAVSYDQGIFIYQLQTDLAPGQTREVIARLTGHASSDPARLAVYPGGLAVPDQVRVRLADARTGRSVERRFVAERPTCVAATRSGECD